MLSMLWSVYASTSIQWLFRLAPKKNSQQFWSEKQLTRRYYGDKKFRCTYFRVDGRPANHIANNDIIKLAKSVSKWAASVAMAKLLDQTPPTTSKHMNAKHNTLAMISFRCACESMPSLRSLSVWQCSMDSWQKKFNFKTKIPFACRPIELRPFLSCAIKQPDNGTLVVAA